MDDIESLIVQGIPADAGFSDDDLRQARFLLGSCRRIACRTVTPSDLGSDITRLRNGYGPWLNIIRTAVERADIPTLERASLLGAYEMATVILFDATQARRLRERQ